MTLKQLSYFVCIARQGSFTSAARRLSVAQSALSRQIRLLEADMGAPLLLRSGHGVTLTDLGRNMLPVAQDIDRLVELIKRAAEAPDTIK